MILVRLITVIPAPESPKTRAPTPLCVLGTRSRPDRHARQRVPVGRLGFSATEDALTVSLLPPPQPPALSLLLQLRDVAFPLSEDIRFVSSMDVCAANTLARAFGWTHTDTCVTRTPGGRAAGPGSVGTRGQRSMPIRAGATWGPWGEGGLIFKGFNPFMTCPCLNAQRTRYTCRSRDLGQRRARPTWAHPQGTLPEPHFCLIQKSHTCVSARFPR